MWLLAKFILLISFLWALRKLNWRVSKRTLVSLWVRKKKRDEAEYIKRIRLRVLGHLRNEAAIQSDVLSGCDRESVKYHEFCHINNQTPRTWLWKLTETYERSLREDMIEFV